MYVVGKNATNLPNIVRWEGGGEHALLSWE